MAVILWPHKPVINHASDRLFEIERDLSSKLKFQGFKVDTPDYLEKLLNIMGLNWGVTNDYDTTCQLFKSALYFSRLMEESELAALVLAMSPDIDDRRTGFRRAKQFGDQSAIYNLYTRNRDSGIPIEGSDISFLYKPLSENDAVWEMMQERSYRFSDYIKAIDLQNHLTQGFIDLYGLAALSLKYRKVIKQQGFNTFGVYLPINVIL